MEESMKRRLAERTAEIETVLEAYLPEETGYQKTVLCAMNYTMRAGGKRLRPMLMDETYRMFGGTDRALVEPFMAAIEMIHTYSLIHDDLPALDNDDYRRGRKTAHIVYGEAMAILAGDALLNYAFETACRALDYAGKAGGEALSRAARALGLLARKPGIYGMIGGQTADVELTDQAVDLETLLFIHEKKTAALIECAMGIGAALAGASEEESRSVERIARNVGLAFQIEDDILDVTSTSEALGKPAGSDEKNGKNTYVSLKGLAQAREDVQAYTAEAIALFDGLGRENGFLRSLLLALGTRTH